MARKREDVINDRVEDLRREIDAKQRIIENDRSSYKEKEAAKKRQLILIERELALLEKLSTLEERRARQEEKLTDLAESYTNSLQDQIKSLKNKEKLGKTLTDNEQKLSNLATEYQDKLKTSGANIKDLIKEHKNLASSIKDEIELEKLMNESQKASLDIIHKKKKAQLEAASEYVKGIETNMRKIPVIGDLLANTLMGPRAQRNLTAKFYKYFKNPKLTKLMQGKGLGVGVMTAGIALTSASIKATLAREQELKDQQRSIGLTNEQTKAVDRMQRRLLMNSSSMVVSLEEARKASAELVEDFGTFGAENEILVDQQVKLTKAFGLTGEEASNFQRTSTIIGRTTEDSKLAVFATAAGFNKLTGSTQSLSGILRTVSRLSDSIRIQFRGSDEELTNAVMKAKALGTSLEDLNGIADQLLNIESSIENQVTAQLVTGRNINLDRARFFALTDNMNGLMDELVKQEIDYASYSKMNRVEKQATAAALGMNVDQMSKFVSQQELATQLGIDMSKAENQTSAGLAESLKMHQATIEARAKLGDAAAKQYMRDNEALTTQEKMTAAVEQMATVFKVLGPILAGLGVIITAIGAALAYAAISAAAIAIAASGGALVPWILGGIAAVAVGLRIYKGMASGGEVVGGSGPVVVGENGPEIVRLKKGNSVTPNSQLNTVGNNNKETNDLLRQILAKVDQPAIIKMGDTTINELGNKINLNRNYSAS